MAILRRTLIGLGPLVLLSVPGRAAPGRIVYLQPLGAELPEADVALVEQALRAMLGIEVRRLARVDLPAAAYYRPRRRYRAEKLLTFLDTRLPRDGAWILGLTGVDISTTKGDVPDWGVLGLGELPGTSGVISAFRCHRKARGPEHARIRLAKVAVHEIGHTLGLDHCPTRGCLMEDAQGKVTTCDREYDFCARCRDKLATAGRPLPARPEIPWADPAQGASR
jgi:archaemetzincin